MNKFEQLIEYVINDEESKARELFHDIVVEKSREIYENLMAEEADEDLEEGVEDIEEGEEDLEEDMGGDASDDLIDDVEAEEESDMNMEGEEDMAGDDMDDMGGDDMDAADMGGDEPASKDDILNLEDKLDQLMAEFEDLMGNNDMGDGDGFGPEEGGDAIEMDDSEEMGMMEAISLKAAPKPVTSVEGGVNKKSTVAANSGAAGMASKPVHTTGDTAHGRPAPSTKELIGRVGNTPAQSTQGLKPATKPTNGQAAGVNTKSPLPGGRKG